jgi:sialic acid synthase SpsE
MIHQENHSTLSAPESQAEMPLLHGIHQYPMVVEISMVTSLSDVKNEFHNGEFAMHDHVLTDDTM